MSHAHGLSISFATPQFAQLHSTRHFDGSLTRHLRQFELRCGLRRLEISLPTPQIRQIIAYCDKDKNGKVSIKELEWLLTTVPDKQSIAFNDPPDVRTWLQQEFLPVRRKNERGQLSACDVFICTLPNAVTGTIYSSWRNVSRKSSTSAGCLRTCG